MKITIKIEAEENDCSKGIKVIMNIYSKVKIASCFISKLISWIVLHCPVKILEYFSLQTMKVVSKFISLIILGILVDWMLWYIGCGNCEIEDSWLYCPRNRITKYKDSRKKKQPLKRCRTDSSFILQRTYVNHCQPLKRCRTDSFLASLHLIRASYKTKQKKVIK
jgi:hypothetical protein